MRERSNQGYRRSIIPALLGGLGYVAVSIIQAAIVPIPEILNTTVVQENILNLVGLFLAGCFIGICISFYSLYYHKISPNNVILRCIVYSIFALLIISVLSSLGKSPGLQYLLISIGYNAPRFLVTGFIAGSVLARKSRTGALEKTATATGKGKRLYYTAGIVVFIVGLGIFGIYQSSLEPASFIASDIHFESSTGTVKIIANITNPSQPSLIQIDASINGQDDGICGYGIATNHTMNCNFFSPNGGPLLSCFSLPTAENYTLKLSAYFGNSRDVTNVYSISAAQLGCSQFTVVPQSVLIYAQFNTSQGVFEAELFQSLTPKTVANFVSLANSGFYNNLVWHRIVPGFVIQTGDPNSRNASGSPCSWGTAGSSSTIPFEYAPSLPNEVGYIGMASTGAGVSGTSQFYINLNNNTSLDGNYTVFGKVISGMNVVDKIGKLPTTSCSSGGNPPTDPSQALLISVNILSSP